MKQINKLKEKLENYKKVKSTLDYLLELNEILYSEIEQNGNTQLEKDDISIILANSADDEICSEIKEIISTTDLLEKDIDKLEINTLLSGKYDYNNAIDIRIHCTQEQEELKLKIGFKCFIECILDGQMLIIMRLKN